jgi:putative Mg2+ transporter-C (MgtC) family protein
VEIAEVFVGIGNGQHWLLCAVRLGTAIALGGLLGFEREEQGKAAGLRTHMLVTLGACGFVLIPLESGYDTGAMARVIQGLVAGVGFLGAGAILKLTAEREIRGLTTAASLWVTATVGLAVGMGWIVPAVLIAVSAWIVLVVLRWLEPLLKDPGEEKGENEKKR